MDGEAAPLLMDSDGGLTTGAAGAAGAGRPVEPLRVKLLHPDNRRREERVRINILRIETDLLTLDLPEDS